MWNMLTIRVLRRLTSLFQQLNDVHNDTGIIMIICFDAYLSRNIPKTFINMVQFASPLGTQALGYREFDSAARLSKRPDSVWNCLWGYTIKRSPRINRKMRVLYPCPGFLSSAAWLLMPKST